MINKKQLVLLLFSLTFPTQIDIGAPTQGFVFRFKARKLYWPQFFSEFHSHPSFYIKD